MNDAGAKSSHLAAITRSNNGADKPVLEDREAVWMSVRKLRVSRLRISPHTDQDPMAPVQEAQGVPEHHLLSGRPKVGAADEQNPERAVGLRIRSSCPSSRANPIHDVPTTLAIEMAQLDLTPARLHPHLTAKDAPSAPRSSSLVDSVVEHLDLLALAVLLVAAAFPASPPTVGQVLGDSGSGFWNSRLGPANAFELMVVAVAALALVRSLVTRPSTSTFDRPLLGAALIVLALQAFALPLHLGDAQYIPLDAERLLIPAAAYVIVTRAIHSVDSLRIFTAAIAAVIGIRTIQLVLIYGIIGETQFGTITGGEALLITEDSLLILLPLALAWGALVDGRLSLPAMIGATALVSSLLLIDLLSLRRGAMLFIGGALLVRSLGIGKRRLAQGAAALLLIAALAVAAGPGRPLLHQLRYTAVSSLLRTNDASSNQRTAEITSFARNTNDADWVIGHGLGVSWQALSKAPIDALSFGPGETDFTRIGWHVYGLDWMYKFGLGGVAAILFALGLMGRELWRGYQRAEPALRSLIYSLVVCAPPFILLLFSNLRVAMMAGLTVGLLSRCCDLASQTKTSPRGREESTANSAETSAA